MERIAPPRRAAANAVEEELQPGVWRPQRRRAPHARTLSNELNASLNSSSCASVSLSITEPECLPGLPASSATLEAFDDLPPMCVPRL